MTRLYVKLTASENTYLKYPCYGLLDILELGTTGSIISAVFRVAVSGKLSAPVVVDKPRFEYSPRIASNGHSAVVELHEREYERRLCDAQRIASGEVTVATYSPKPEDRAVFNPFADFGSHPDELLHLASQIAGVTLTPEMHSAARNLGIAVAARGTPNAASLIAEWQLVPELQEFAAKFYRAAIPGA